MIRSTLLWSTLLIFADWLGNVLGGHGLVTATGLAFLWFIAFIIGGLTDGTPTRIA